jgi:hypothetical protein
MTTEQATATRTMYFEPEWRFLQLVTAAALDCGFKVADFKLGGNRKDRVMTLKITRPEDDSGLIAAGQTDLPFDGGDGVGPARAEQHNDGAFRQGRPQLAPPPSDPPPWYDGPSGSDKGDQS